VSVALTTTISVRNIIEEIASNVPSILNATRATVYMNDLNENRLAAVLTLGEWSGHGAIFAREAVQHRRCLLFDHQAVIGRPQTQQPNTAIERILEAGLDAVWVVFGRESNDSDEDIIQEEEPAPVPAFAPPRTRSPCRSPARARSRSSQSVLIAVESAAESARRGQGCANGDFLNR
jgi:hypothetical protein